MRIGYVASTVEHRAPTAEAALQFARERGLDGVQLDGPEAIDASLDLARLVAFRRRADASRLFLEVGLPSPNPCLRPRADGGEVGAADLARLLVPQVEAVAALGCRHARVTLGDRHDRFRADVPWATQVEATVAVLKLLSAPLRDLGVRVAVETHADLTCDELLAILDAVGPETAGVTLDTGNLVMRLDEPVAAATRLAPFVLSAHVKDAVLAFTPRGLWWQARAVGSGILPIPDLLGPLRRANPALNLSIELHPRTYDLPIFDPAWLAYFPALRPESLAAVVRLAARCERRYAEGTLERPEVVEAVPWEGRDLDWLARSLGYLRRVVDMLGRL